MGYKFNRDLESDEGRDALKRTFNDLDIGDLASIVAYAQRHECHATTCRKNSNPLDSTCKAGFPQKPADETFIEVEEKFNKANQMYLKIKMHVRRSQESSETN